MEEEPPEWLPQDWEFRVKVRATGKKDKYYINPSNGLKFNSKPEVLRYLEKSKKDLKRKVPNKTISNQAVAQNLPSGWIKEIKITKKGGKTRKVPYYIDPVSGRHFRSMQEVNRYLETDVGKSESNKDVPSLTNEELDHSKSSTVVSEEQRLIDKKDDEMPNENDSIKSEGAAVGNISPPETDAVGQSVKEKDSVGEDEQQEKVATAPQNKRKKSKGKWMNDLPRRSSKRLARVEADPPLDVAQVNTIKEAGVAAVPLEVTQVNTIENINKLEISTSEDSGKQKEQTHIPDSGKQKEQTHIPDSGKQKEEQTHTPDSGKQKEEQTHVPPKDVSSIEEHAAVGNGTDSKKDEMSGKQLGSSLNDLLMDPCIEFAIKTLTGAIPIEDLNKFNNSSVASRASPNQTSGNSAAPSLGNIWADPCFEFAVKTLTSENPVEGGSNLQISFEQPRSSSGAGGCNGVAKFDPSMKDNKCL